MSEPSSDAISVPANPLANLRPVKKPRQYTLAEFLRKEAGAVRKHEYHNGQIIPMPYAKAPHNIIGANVSAALHIGIDRNGKDFLVLSSDQMVYFPSINTGVYADVLVVCEKMEFYDKDQLLLTNPILVVEVLSKSTRRYDQQGKFELYKTLPSLREYVLIEQDKCSVETRFRVEPNLWRDQFVTNLETDIWLESLGFTIAMKDVYKKVPGI